MHSVLVVLGVVVLVGISLFGYLQGWRWRWGKSKLTPASGEFPLLHESLLDEALRKKATMAAVQRYLNELMETTGIRCDVANKAQAAIALFEITGDTQIMAAIATLRKAGVVIHLGMVPSCGSYISDCGDVWLDENATHEQLRAFLLRS